MTAATPSLPLTSPRAGLRLWPADPYQAAVAAAAAILGVTVVILLGDLAARGTLPAWYVATFAGGGLQDRITAFMVLAVVEEFKYRLLLMSALILAGRWLLRGRWPLSVVVAAAVLAQIANLAPHLPAPESAGQLAWMVVRYLMPGLVWSWLYWRHGFVTAALAHPVCHLLLQPALLIALR